MGVAGNAIGVAVADGDEGLVPIGFRFNGTSRAQQRAVRAVRSLLIISERIGVAKFVTRFTGKSALVPFRKIRGV
jgi:hypothetical protein